MPIINQNKLENRAFTKTNNQHPKSHQFSFVFQNVPKNCVVCFVENELKLLFEMF